MKIITFFNNKGGVGKTTMVYHLSWMFSELGIKVLAADFDPQANLSSMFLPDERLIETLEEDKKLTVLDSIIPVSEGEGYQPVHLEVIDENIGLIIGNLALSTFEDKLSDAWLKCLGKDIYSFRLMSVFQTILADAAARMDAEIVLVDVGPNLGAINRAVLISTDFVVIPVASDLFSLQGMKNLGITLREWRENWNKRKLENPRPERLRIPEGKMTPTGYVVMQYNAKERRPVRAYLRWADRIPAVYAQYVLDESVHADSVETDPNCLGLLKHYHSLAPMAMEAHKPIFLLKPADGAIGAHLQAAQRSYTDFKLLAQRIMTDCYSAA
jgi:cellulose biosynthesis protein BcsQ